MKILVGSIFFLSCLNIVFFRSGSKSGDEKAASPKQQETAQDLFGDDMTDSSESDTEDLTSKAKKKPAVIEDDDDDDHEGKLFKVFC